MAKANRVLSLGGDGDYVEMSDSEALNDIGSQVTMEAWIKPTAFPNEWIAIIHKADERVDNFGNRSYVLMLNSQGFIQLASAPSKQGQIEIQSPSGLISLDNWYHIAGVVDAENGVMRIFVNGAEVARGDFAGDIHVSKLPLWVGWTHDSSPQSASFAGQMDEVRIWNIARTQEEIRETIHSHLTGSEPRLVGYWQFNDRSDMVTDSSPNQIHGKLIGDARIMEAEFPRPDELDIPAMVSGTVRDELGNPVNVALVRLMHGDVEIAQVWTDISGRYYMLIPRLDDGLYDLYATSGEKIDSDIPMGKHGQMLLDVPLHRGESKSLDLTLQEDISIQGTLHMLDDKTPHAYVAVQAIRNGKVINTTWSNEDGEYWFVSLRPGKYHVRCQVLGGYVYYGVTSKELRVTGNELSNAEPEIGKLLQVERSKTLKNIDFRFAPFKKGKWRNYTPVHGLASPAVHSICEDKNGMLWFTHCSWNLPTGGNGVSCYDGKEFVIFTTEDGLTSNNVWTVHSTHDGILWFGTRDNGVSRYDGKEFVNFTTEDGLAHNDVRAIDSTPDGVLWFGTLGGGVSRYDGSTFANFTIRDGLASNQVTAVHCDPDGTVWFGTWNSGVSRYDGREFVNFGIEDGLLDGRVTAIHRDSSGVLWLGTGNAWNRGHGVFRYDGTKFDNLTFRDGLWGLSVQAINSTSDGALWFGTPWGLSRYDGETFVNFGNDGPGWFVESIYVSSDGTLWIGTGLNGVFRYDEKSFVSLNLADGLPGGYTQATYRSPDGSLWIGTDNGIARYDDGMESGLSITFTQEDGLVPLVVSVIHRAADGNLWFGTGGFDVRGRGIFRYDGTDDNPASFVNFTTKDGLAHDRIQAIQSAADGTMWIGTAGGVSRYDGKEFVNLTTEDGLIYNWIEDIHRDMDGILWFGTYRSGVSRYDGKEFVSLATENGLIHNHVTAIHSDPGGVIWLGTWSGISRYDGEKFVNFTQKDELSGNMVEAVYCAPNGITWFGVYGGGVSGFDGVAWTSLDTRDGLLDDMVISVDPDTDGSLWIGTDKGVTRYRRNDTPPRVQIVSVTADKTYHDLSIIPPFNPGTRVTVSYNAIDLKTLPEKRQYRCRIKEIDLDWRKPTKETSFDWLPEKPGTYTFQVQAIDRDLNYSEPASLQLEVVPDPRNEQIVRLESDLEKRNRELEQANAELEQAIRLAEQELQDAQNMQMSLLPQSPPALEGFDIAGSCKPAREVGGDFFDYLSLPGGRTGIALADISGKGLKAAMNAILVDGMLREIAKNRTSCGEILSTLNADLCPLMEKQMFAALELAIIDRETSILRWSNAAQPYPMIRQGEQVSELKGSGGLPLGMMQNMTYPDWELPLCAGDIVIFYSDGIIEGENEAEEMYGAERLEQVIARMNPAINAVEIIETISRDFADFVGDTEQYDDVTIVVVKKL